MSVLIYNSLNILGNFVNVNVDIRILFYKSCRNVCFVFEY